MRFPKNIALIAGILAMIGAGCLPTAGRLEEAAPPSTTVEAPMPVPPSPEDGTPPVEEMEVVEEEPAPSEPAPAPSPAPSPMPAPEPPPPAPEPEPTCTEDVWECGDWSACSSDGTQSRECAMTFDCPDATTPSPATSRSCTPPPPPAPSPVSMTIEADDSGFYPGGPLEFENGTQVTITFRARSANVYYGGLDFRSSKFTTSTVQPGGSTTVNFTADQNFTITSYWPVSNVKKADLFVRLK